MRRAFIAQAFVAGLLVVVGCGETPLAPSESEIEPEFSIAGLSRGTAEVFAFGDPPTPVYGVSSARRTNRAVRARIRTTELVPFNAYTAWLVIFNNPEACTDGCGEDDLFNAEARVDVVYLAGRVASRRGWVSLRGRRSVRNKSGSLFALLGAPAPGLVDPRGAEVHVIVRDHGPRIRGKVREQLRTFEGGCTPESSFGLGDGPNECADVQFAIHLPE